jgi:hypothetical protein
MQSNQALLIAALVVLTIIVAFFGYRAWSKKNETNGTNEGFVGPSHRQVHLGKNPHQQYVEGKYNPYTVLNKQLDETRGYRNDGYNQPSFYRHPQGLDRYHRSGANLSPEDISEAERDLWYSSLETSSAEKFNPENSHDAAADSTRYHETAPGIDYDTYVTDLISDPRTRDNHRRWVAEMKPWSGVAMKVDTLDLEPYVNFTGLRRPQAVVQNNPLQLTEVDTHDLAVNRPFNFQG